MNFPLYIARRYLFAKKSHNAINVISMVSVCGVVVATIAMICTLSVFNGFKDLTTTLFSVFDPELKIMPVEGKVFDPTTPEMAQMRKLPEIQVCSEVLQENALVRYGERQEISVVKGVDDSFRQLAQIDTVIIDGHYILQDGETTYTVLGIGLAATLGVNAAFSFPLEIYMPKRDESINLANPATSFRNEYAYVGGVYHINQPVYDEGFMLLPISVMRSMLNYEKEVSALELKLTPNADIYSVKKKISHIIGKDFVVKDRYEQQESSFKMVQVEKWVSFLMLCFILILALFNVVGTLAILMIEKSEDINKLRSMGADNHLINRIFLFEGWLISLLGAFIGVLIGLLLCFLQQRFGLISLGQTAGTFVVDAYPVKVEWIDVVVVFITVVTIGFLAAWYPVHYLGKKWLSKGVAILVLPLLLMGCGGQKDENNTVREIAVTIEPQRYFAQKIAGDNYKIFSVVPVGQSAETYDPTPREMVHIGQSSAYFKIGQLGFEQQLTETMQKNNPKLQFFNLSDKMKMIEIEEDDDHLKSDDVKSANSMHIHNHGGQDPHIWMSFSGAKIIADNIFQALTAIDSVHHTAYESNYKVVISQIDSLEYLLHKQLDSVSCRSFVIYHPALTYFAREFGFTQYSIEAEGKEPSPASIKQLIEDSKAAHVKVVFVQQEFDGKYAEQIAEEIGARVIVINPLDYNWDKQMMQIAKALSENGKAN